MDITTAADSVITQLHKCMNTPATTSYAQLAQYSDSLPPLIVPKATDHHVIDGEASSTSASEELWRKHMKEDSAETIFGASSEIIELANTLPLVAEALVSSSRVYVDSAVTAKEEPTNPPSLELVETEMQLKTKVLELSAKRLQLIGTKARLSESAHCVVEEFEEHLYLLHEMLSRAGRGGQFTSFVRDELKWPGKRAYDKAMRWIAKYELRAGLISKDEYARRQGNKKENTTLRSVSEATPGTTPKSPVITRLATWVVTDDAPDAALTTEYSPEDLAAREADLERQSMEAIRVKLMRVLLPAGLMGFFESAVRHQMRLHGAKSFQETVFKVFLLGSKSAAPDDDWGQVLEEIFKSVGTNPELACQPDPTDHDPDWGPNPNRSNEEVKEK
jgi:hypothetical protein